MLLCLKLFEAEITRVDHCDVNRRINLVQTTRNYMRVNR